MKHQSGQGKYKPGPPPGMWSALLSMTTKVDEIAQFSLCWSNLRQKHRSLRGLRNRRSYS